MRILGQAELAETVQEGGRVYSKGLLASAVFQHGLLFHLKINEDKVFSFRFWHFLPGKYSLMAFGFAFKSFSFRKRNLLTPNGSGL